MPVPHGAAVFTAIVLDHIDHGEDSPAAGSSEDTVNLLEGGPDILDVVENQHANRGIDGLICDRQVIYRGFDEPDVFAGAQALFRGGEHGAGLVDGDNLFHHGAEEFGCVAGAAAYIGDHPVWMDEGEKGGGGEAAAEKVSANMVPLAADAAKIVDAVGFAVIENGQNAAVIFVEVGRGLEFGIEGGPNSLGGGGQLIRGEVEEGGGSFSAFDDPACIREDFELAISPTESS